jgi:hypothetical protein
MHGKGGRYLQFLASHDFNDFAHQLGIIQRIVFIERQSVADLQ